ncbi:M12 family metallopeptidase [Marinimicrobium locisalis]|uniref:M12 family metallopeptidase n=1 Tax=Marinimicrobium locisalis TaxID=546022 RepID=UPI00322171BB
MEYKGKVLSVVVAVLSLAWASTATSEIQRLPLEEELPDSLGETYISGFGFYNKKVVYEKVNGLAVLEGDIILGTVEEAERWKELHSGTPSSEIGPQSIIITGQRYRWPNNVIPFQFSEEISAPIRSTTEEAIAHWEANTPIRFVERTAQNADEYPDFVEIVNEEEACRATVGRRTGRQTVNLFERCSFGNVVHEFGHTLGLWHEHSREDRDEFIEIKWSNIDPDPAIRSNFNQHIDIADDIGKYDYNSIMHYGPYAYAVDKTLPTIVPTQDGVQIGQREGLSQGDIASITEHYPEFLPQAKIARSQYSVFWGNEVFLDGRSSYAPNGEPLSFSWRLGDGTMASGVRRLTHLYSERGQYTSTLTVVDTDGNQDEDQATVTVYGVEAILPAITMLL